MIIDEKLLLKVRERIRVLFKLFPGTTIGIGGTYIRAHIKKHVDGRAFGMQTAAHNQFSTLLCRKNTKLTYGGTRVLWTQCLDLNLGNEMVL